MIAIRNIQIRIKLIPEFERKHNSGFNLWSIPTEIDEPLRNDLRDHARC